MNNQLIKSFRSQFLKNILERIDFLINDPFLEEKKVNQKYSQLIVKREKLFINIYLKLKKSSPSLYRYRGGMEIHKMITSIESTHHHYKDISIDSFEEIEHFDLIKDSYFKTEPIIPYYKREERKEENKLIREEFYEIEENPYRNTAYLVHKFLRIHAHQKFLSTGKLREERKREIEDPYIFLADPKDLNDPFEESYKQVDSFIEEIFFEDIFKELIENIKNGYFLTASFTESDNSPLMWGHYAESGKGVILEYDSSSLLAELNQNLILFPIYYTDNYMKEFNSIKKGMRDSLKKLSFIINSKKNIDLSNNSLSSWFFHNLVNVLTDIKLLFQTVKTKKWAYEKEWKALKISNIKSPFNRDKYASINKGTLLSVGYIKEKNSIQESLRELINSFYSKENSFRKEDWYHLSNSSFSPHKFEPRMKNSHNLGTIKFNLLIREKNILFLEKDDTGKILKRKIPFFDIYSQYFFSPVEKDLTEEKFSLLDLVFQEIEIEEEGIKIKKKIIPIYHTRWEKGVYAFFSPTSKRTLIFEDFLDSNQDSCILRKRIINEETKEFFNTPERFLLLNLGDERRIRPSNRHYWDKESKENFTFEEVFKNNHLKNKKISCILREDILYEKVGEEEVPFLRASPSSLFLLREKEKRVQKFIKENIFNSLSFHIFDRKNRFNKNLISLNSLKKEAIKCRSINNEVYTEFKGKEIKILNIFNEKEKTLEAKEFFKEYPFPLLKVSYYTDKPLELKEYIYSPEEGDIYKVDKILSLKYGVFQEI